MALQNKIEFAALVCDLVIRLGKFGHQFGASPKVQKARRTLDIIKRELDQEDPSKERHLERLSEVAAVCRLEINTDQQMEDDFYDLLDFLEFRT